MSKQIPYLINLCLDIMADREAMENGKISKRTFEKRLMCYNRILKSIKHIKAEG